MESTDVVSRSRRVMRSRMNTRQRRILKVILLVLHMWQLQRQCRPSRRSPAYWVRPIFRLRETLGAYHTLVQEMSARDPESYFNYFRMTPDVFNELCHRVHPLIAKHNTPFRKSISVEERLAITLRYLASGDMQRSILYQFRVAHQTVSKIIRETCEAIWTVLVSSVLPSPSQEAYNNIASEFWSMWDFPNCCGAIDGKHVQIIAPGNTGSEYFNYKRSFSIVLLAVCDAQYRFLMVDIGSSGSNSDGGVFSASAFGKALSSGSMKLPLPSPLPLSDISAPFTFIGDAAFPLKTYMMRPHPGLDLPDEKAIFNYRLSRARRTIENAFGILGARFRILRRPITAHVQTAISIVKACVCLHNFLKRKQDEDTTNNIRYCPLRFVDYEGPNGEQIPGEWRHICNGDAGLTDVVRMGSNNHTVAAAQVRENLTRYFLSSEGRVPWQDNVINRGCVATRSLNGVNNNIRLNADKVQIYLLIRQLLCDTTIVKNFY